jgi:hypothetical protein
MKEAIGGWYGGHERERKREAQTAARKNLDEK